MLSYSPPLKAVTKQAIAVGVFETCLLYDLKHTVLKIEQDGSWEVNSRGCRFASWQDYNTVLATNDPGQGGVDSALAEKSSSIDSCVAFVMGTRKPHTRLLRVAEIHSPCIKPPWSDDLTELITLHASSARPKMCLTITYDRGIHVQALSFTGTVCSLKKPHSLTPEGWRAEHGYADTTEEAWLKLQKKLEESSNAFLSLYQTVIIRSH